MKVLVTGGTGFIGSHTVVELLNENYEVVVIDNFCNSKRVVLEKIKQITNKSFSFYEIDIRDKQAIDSVFKKEHIDAVIHFAALKSGADSINDPGTYYVNNIEGTYNILKAMDRYNVNKIIFSSSATVYGDSQNVPITEDEKIGDVISPYGMTKYLTELLLNSKSDQSNCFKAISLRYFNPIGAHPSGLIGEDSPDDVPNNLILYILKVAKKEFPYLKVFGNDYRTPDGSGIRDYIHVVDLAKGHIAALRYIEKMPKKHDVFNLGTGKGHTVIELVRTFEKENNIEVPYQYVPRRPGDVEISFADCSKANKLMGWHAQYTMDDALRDAWNFAKNKSKD